MTDDPDGSILPFCPTARHMATKIRQIASYDIHVYLGRDAREWIIDTGVTRLDVIRALSNPVVDGPSWSGTWPGEWVCQVIVKVVGSKPIRIEVSIRDGDKLLIKTLSWEDLR
jgi:hypothetical protein